MRIASTKETAVHRGVVVAYLTKYPQMCLQALGTGTKLDHPAEF